MQRQDDERGFRETILTNRAYLKAKYPYRCIRRHSTGFGLLKFRYYKKAYNMHLMGCATH